MPKKHKKTEASPVPSGLQVWQPLSKPDSLPDGAVCILPGTTTEYTSKKDGKKHTRVQSGLVIALPKVVDVMAKNGLTEAQAKERIGAIAKSIKPAVSGRVNQAMASDSYGIRRYAESKAGALTVSLYPVNVSDIAAGIAAQTGLSVEEVYKRMPELRPKSELTLNV